MSDESFVACLDTAIASESLVGLKNYKITVTVPSSVVVRSAIVLQEISSFVSK
jgi:hypothetical protein